MEYVKNNDRGSLLKNRGHYFTEKRRCAINFSKNFYPIAIFATTCYNMLVIKKVVH